MMGALKTYGGLTQGRGMEESTCNQCIAIAHQFVAIHESMLGLTRVNRIMTEQHIYMSGVGEAGTQMTLKGCMNGSKSITHSVE